LGPDNDQCSVLGKFSFWSSVAQSFGNLGDVHAARVLTQMHHMDTNQVRAAYLRTDFYEQRVPMMTCIVTTL
jgi:hypothetical protein